MAKRKSRRGVPVGVQVTGRSVAYVQPVGRGGKLGKAQPVVLTTVRVTPQRKKKGK